MEIKISKIVVKENIREEDYGDLTELTASIKENGIRQPIELNSKNELIDGHRRLKAAKAADLKEIPYFINDAEVVKAVIIKNRYTSETILESNKKTIKEAIIEAIQKKADLSKADLRWADLSEANLSEANLSEADLSKANLSKADLSKANLSKADLSEANLSKADLSWADLSKANLSWADLSEADLSEADLSKADYWKTNFWSIKVTKETKEQIIKIIEFKGVD